MRLSLTPPDSALPSPARPPAPAPRARVPRPALSRLRPTRKGLQHPLAQALSPRSPALRFTCLRGPAAGGSLRGSSSASRLPAARLPHLPPVRSCTLPPSSPGSRGCQAAAQTRRTAKWWRLGRAKSGQEVDILRRTLAVPPRPEGTRFFPKRRGDQKGPPLREERSFGWGAGQWEARTAAQRGAAAECKHSPASVRPRVSPRATRRAPGTTRGGCGTPGQPCSRMPILHFAPARRPRCHLSLREWTAFAGDRATLYLPASEALESLAPF
nr:translation initiation factor IF-2-like [Equus asinus]